MEAVDSSITAIGLFYLIFRPKVKKTEVKKYLFKFRPFVGPTLLIVNSLLFYFLWNSRAEYENQVSIYNFVPNSNLITLNIFLYGFLVFLSLVYLLLKPNEQKVDNYLSAYKNEDLVNLNNFKEYLLANIIFVGMVLNVGLSAYNFMYPILRATSSSY